MEDKHIFVFILVSLAFFASAMPSRNVDRPFYIECVSSSECGKGQCCTIGTGRFSIPTCRSVLDKGEICRPTAEDPSVSMNVTYPDGKTISFENIYHNLCPCAPNLQCSFETGTCEDFFEHEYNFIDNNY